MCFWTARRHLKFYECANTGGSMFRLINCYSSWIYGRKCLRMIICSAFDIYTGLARLFVEILSYIGTARIPDRRSIRYCFVIRFLSHTIYASHNQFQIKDPDANWAKLQRIPCLTCSSYSMVWLQKHAISHPCSSCVNVSSELTHNQSCSTPSHWSSL